MKKIKPFFRKWIMILPVASNLVAVMAFFEFFKRVDGSIKPT